jgi:eukaryotic-like serine/threonine-protein kinase
VTGTSGRGGAALFWRLFLATAAVVAVVLAIVLGVLAISADRAADAGLARGLAASRLHVTALLDGRERALTSAALVFAQNPSFRALVLARRPPDLLDQAEEAVQRTGATWVQIADADGLRLAKSDEPAAPLATLAGTALVGGALAGEVTAGAGIAGDTAIFLGVAVPVLVGAPEEGALTPRVAGVLVAARLLDSALAREIKEVTASEVLIYRIDAAGAAHVVTATLPDTAALGSMLARHVSGGRAEGADSTALEHVEVTAEGTRYVGQGQLLHSAGGDALGGVLTLRSRAVELAPFASLRRGIVLAGVFGLALACALSYAAARHITRPILALTAAARRAISGDFSAAAVPVDSPGEIAALADAVHSVLSDVQGRHAVAEYLGRARATPSRARADDGDPDFLMESVESAESLAAFSPGRTLAERYEIDKVLGVGGTGIVYRAHDRELGETVAIKTLRPEALAGGAAALERFKEETRLARRISHPNVVRIHDIGEAGGVYFITMEYVAGVSLDHLIDRAGRLPVPVAVAAGRQLCQALGVAHGQGIIHRDIKPQNVMLQPDGTLKVMDFGVARLTERSTGITVVGMVVGTPAYMAPEQLLGEELDQRVDVYAAGVVLYECLTGRHPFEADSPAALIAKLLTERPVAPRALNPEVPPELSDLVLQALARDRDARPRTAAELDARLARAGRGAPPAGTGRRLAQLDESPTPRPTSDERAAR